MGGLSVACGGTLGQLDDLGAQRGIRSPWRDSLSHTSGFPLVNPTNTVEALLGVLRRAWEDWWDWEFCGRPLSGVVSPSRRSGWIGKK